MSDLLERDLILYVDIFLFVAFAAFGYLTIGFIRDWLDGENGLTVALGFFTGALMLGELWSIIELTEWLSPAWSISLKAAQVTFLGIAFINMIIQHYRMIARHKELDASKRQRKPNQGDKATSTGPSSDA